MLRSPLAAAALLLGLAVAPALAQPLAPGQPEESAAARTMAQNRKVVIGQPMPAIGKATEQAAARPEPARRPDPAVGGRPVAMAEGAAKPAR